MKTRSKELVDKLLSVCTAHGFFFQKEVAVNSEKLTCYNYGPVGSLLRSNLIKEWWKGTAFNKYNVYPVESSVTENISGALRRDESFHLGALDHYLPTLHFAEGNFPFGVAGVFVRHQVPDPNDHYFVRSHERTDLLLTYFIPPHQSSQWMDLLQRKRLSWWKQLSQHPTHYKFSDQAAEGNMHEVGINFEYPWGSQSVESIVNHGERPLIEAQEKTSLDLQVLHQNQKVMPHVIECRAHLEQGMLSFLVDGVTERRKKKNSQSETTMALHPRIAGYKIAIVVDCDVEQTSAHLQEVADHLAVDLRSSLIATLNLKEQSQNVDEQLVKYDRMGVPMAVILQKDTLTSGAVLLRWRTTTLKEKVNLTMLKDKVISYVTKS